MKGSLGSVACVLCLVAPSALSFVIPRPTTLTSVSSSRHRAQQSCKQKPLRAAEVIDALADKLIQQGSSMMSSPQPAAAALAPIAGLASGGLVLPVAAVVGVVGIGAAIAYATAQADAAAQRQAEEAERRRIEQAEKEAAEAERIRLEKEEAERQRLLRLDEEVSRVRAEAQATVAMIRQEMDSAVANIRRESQQRIESTIATATARMQEVETAAELRVQEIRGEQTAQEVAQEQVMSLEQEQEEATPTQLFQVTES